MHPTTRSRRLAKGKLLLFTTSLLLGAVSGFGQIVALPGIQSNYVVSSAGFTLGTFATGIQTGALVIVYNTNLDPAQYVAKTQLTADLAGFFTSYPNPQDPIEAIASSMLTSILQKYPQINGGELTLTSINLQNPTTSNVVYVVMGTIGSTNSGANTPSAILRNAAQRAGAARQQSK